MEINEKILDSLKLFDLQELYEICKSMDNFFCYLETYSSSSSKSSDDDVKYNRETSTEEKIDNIKKSLGWCLWFLNLLSKYRVKYVHPYHLAFLGDHFFISISLEILKSISFHFFENKVDILLSYYSKDNPPKIYSKTFDLNKENLGRIFNSTESSYNFKEILDYINPYLLDVKYCNLPLAVSKDEKELFIFYETNYKIHDEFYNFLTNHIIKIFDDIREKQNGKK